MPFGIDADYAGRQEESVEQRTRDETVIVNDAVLKF
jgi:hypothetical protein